MDESTLDLGEPFPPVSTADWEQAIRRDVERRSTESVEELLTWTPCSDLSIRAYYRADDLAGLKHLGPQAPAVQICSDWKLRQDVPARADAVRAAVDGGADLVGVSASESSDALERLPELAGSLGEAHLHVGGRLVDADAQERLLAAIERMPPGTLETASIDPMTELMRTGGGEMVPTGPFVALLGRMPRGIRPLVADGSVFHNAGGSLVFTTALVLASIAEYLTSMTRGDRGVDELIERLYITLPINTSYFLEIARLRAVRLLLPQLLGAFGASATSVPVHAVTSRRSMTLYDPHANLLRATTEAASAVLGGCDVLVVQPFDDLLTADRMTTDQSTTAGDLGRRLARNLQHVLRHEAHMDKVDDPAAGSYYLEHLTDRVARAVWHRFQEIEAAGGLAASWQDGSVQADLDADQARLRRDVAQRRRILVGTNRFPDPDERRLGDGAHASNAESGPWAARRAGEDIETVRLRVERFAARRRRPVVAAVVPVGGSPSALHRAQLAGDALACAGINGRIEDPPATREALTAPRPDVEIIVVAGSDDAIDPDLIHDIIAANPLSIIGYYADEEGTDQAAFRLHKQMNLVDSMGKLLDLLGVEGAS